MVGPKNPWTGRRVGLVALLALALLASSLVVPRLVPLLAPAPRAAAQAAPPSGGFALHGGLGGRVDERTGQMSVMVPLTTVSGQGVADVSVSLSWQQERATAAVAAGPLTINNREVHLRTTSGFQPADTVDT
jgi:hypothetical protein